MVNTKVSLVTFPNPMVTSGFVPVELFELLSLSAAAIMGKVEPSKKIRVIMSGFSLCIG